MKRDAPFMEGEIYHIYNRGAHKGEIFKNEKDYERFLLLLHVANTEERIDLRAILRKYKGQTFAQVFEQEKPTKSLVDLYAYCLMPNHFHLIVGQKNSKGITNFARKVLTAYSMYFNLTHKHSGILSQGAFKSRHINNESYFRYIFSYVHLNPLSLVSPNWEVEGVMNIDKANKFLNTYPYSSFYDYSVGFRNERSILCYNSAPDFLKTQNDIEEFMSFYKTGLK